MTAAERKLLRAHAAMVAEFIAPPNPSGIYDDRWEQEQRAFQNLQHDRAIKVQVHMKWIADQGKDVISEVQLSTTMMAREIAEPLPYTVKVEEPGNRYLS